MTLRTPSSDGVHARRVLVTGGAGFIGSEVVRQLLGEPVDLVVTVDALTYAGHEANLAEVADDPRHHLVRADIADADAMRGAFARYRPDLVLHLAAESHVDRSIDGPDAFLRTNVIGTFTLLQQSLQHWRTLDGAAREAFRFVHVSTDEVFGSLGETGAFDESTPYDPRSPYSASKAASDHLARAWHHTYGLPVVVTNCSNNYGPYQYPEKLIPLMIRKALDGEPLPVYGRGENVRDWLHVRDHARALRLAARRGVPGATYLVGGSAERRNLEVVHAICDALDELRPDPAGSRRRLITHVTDRPGHDHRYAIDARRIREELGWVPSVTFAEGLRETIAWYLTNEAWVRTVTAERYDGARLGLRSAA